jgi:hypothetical protein
MKHNAKQMIGGYQEHWCVPPTFFWKCLGLLAAFPGFGGQYPDLETNPSDSRDHFFRTTQMVIEL